MSAHTGSSMASSLGMHAHVDLNACFASVDPSQHALSMCHRRRVSSFLCVLTYHVSSFTAAFATSHLLQLFYRQVIVETLSMIIPNHASMSTKPDTAGKKRRLSLDTSASAHKKSCNTAQL